MDLHPALTATFAIAAGLVALATLWRSVLGPAWSKAMAALRMIEQFGEDWNGVPAQPARPGHPAVPERPGVLAHLDHVDETLLSHGKKLGVIHHEVLPNNGSSMRDAVNRLETNAKESTTDRSVLHRRIDDVTGRLDDLAVIVDELRTERAPTTHVEVQLNPTPPPTPEE